MVLLLSAELKASKKDKTVKYQLTPAYENTVGIVTEVNAEPPEEEEVLDGLASLELQDRPPFFIRCHGIMDNTIPPSDDPEESVHGAPKEPSWIEKLMDKIEISASRRENVTIINRGYKSEEYLQSLMLQLFRAVKISSQHGMQVVADEIAKERQMQRLLQLEAENEPNAGGDGNLAKGEDGRDYQKQVGLPIPARLRQKLAELQKEFPYECGKSTIPAKERYSLLSAGHGDELLPPCRGGSCLVPYSFVVHPPVYRRGTTNATTNDSQLRSAVHLYQRLRRPTALLLDQLEGGQRNEVEPLKGNGWGNEVSFYVFNGESSIMALPGIPKFEELIKRFALDFWIRTDCKVQEGPRVLFQVMESRSDVGQMFSVTLNFYPEFRETLRLFIRDSQNRVLEGYVPLHETDLVSGAAFHHVMIKVHNLDECRMECSIDCKDIPFTFLQQEHPIAFNAWPHRLFIGGFLDENHTPQSVFRGSIMEFRVWGGQDTFDAVIRWPLMVRDGPLVEMTKTIAEDHHETLQNLQVTTEPAPRCAPVFDGQLVVNVGVLPLWGQLMLNWRMEIRFRTTCSTRAMNLMGVTDRKFKMQQIGIVLNAEPVSSKDRYRFHELNVTFYIVDCFGACCSALFRGTERENLMDGQWHTIIWRCVDAEKNSFIIHVDGVQCNLLFVAREGPNRFAAFDDWICLGGHNVRSWKVQKNFEGEISRFYLTLRGHHYVTLETNEGPGAYVLQDLSGHHNHGLLLHSDTQVIRKNDVIWVPVPPEKIDGDDENKIEIISYRNNAVSIAGIVFTGQFGESTVPHEILFDLFHQKESVVEATTDHLCSRERGRWGTWYKLKEECYVPLENVTQLEEALNNVLSMEKPCGHLLVVIRIGDCHISLLQLRDSELPADASYSTNMLKWNYPFGIEGQHGRSKLLLHRMVEGVEKVLVADSPTPYTAVKLGPLNCGSHTFLSEEIVGKLRDNTKPWYLAGVLHTLLLNVERGSQLHIIHRFPSVMAFDEAAALCMYNKKLFDRSKELAALVIQRNWRGWLGQQESMKRNEICKLKNRKVEEIRSLRMNPVVHPRKKLKAVLISLHHPRCSLLSPIKESLTDLEESLEKQGYAVTHVADPTLSQLVQTLGELQLDSSSFVYVSGYGGRINIRQAPLFSFQSLHVYLSEGAARAQICAEEGQTYREEFARFMEEKKLIKPKKKKKKGSKAAAPARNKKAEAEREAALKQAQILFQEALFETERDESFLRDAMMKEYETDVVSITNEIRIVTYVTNKFVMEFKTQHVGDDEGLNMLYLSSSTTVEPYSTMTLNVEDLITIALNRGNAMLGFQRVLAMDLQPITPYSQGFACIASSTGNTLRFSYKPQQKRYLSWVLQKALDGHANRLPVMHKYAILSGGLETAENQRDWKSFAMYIAQKMKPACSSVAEYRKQVSELERELPFTAELIPVRDIIMTQDARDRRRRDREGGKVVAAMVFGVGSTKVQSDMFSVFKNFLENLPLSELAFTNTINILFENRNKNIDVILVPHLTQEIEKCRPNHCQMSFDVSISSEGAQVKFHIQESADRMNVGQWVSSIVVHSLSWKIAADPSISYATLEVSYVEYLYHVKTSCKLRQFRRLKKQLYCKPIPEQYIRFIEVVEVGGGAAPTS